MSHSRPWQPRGGGARAEGPRAANSPKIPRQRCPPPRRPGGHAAGTAQPWEPRSRQSFSTSLTFLPSPSRQEIPRAPAKARRSHSPTPGKGEPSHGRFVLGEGRRGDCHARRPLGLCTGMESLPPQRCWESQPRDKDSFREKPKHGRGCYMRPERRAEPGSHHAVPRWKWLRTQPGGRQPRGCRRAGARGDVGQKRRDKWKGQVGPGAGAAASDRGRKLASETTGSLTGAVSPGAPRSTAAARKGVVNGVLFGLLVIWDFIFQTSSPHGINESRRSSPRAQARRRGPGSCIQHKLFQPLPHMRSHLCAAFHQVTSQPDQYPQLVPHSSPPQGNRYRRRHREVQGHALSGRQGERPISGWCRLCHMKLFLKLKHDRLRVGVNH